MTRARAARGALRPAIDEDAAGRKNLALLIQLRWTAVGGQMIAIVVARFVFGVGLPYGPMAAVLGGLVALNLVSHARLVQPGQVARLELFTALLFDVAALTLQLYFTGGGTNPFTFLYLLQVTLGAVLLEGWYTWAMAGLTGLCFAGLTLFSWPLDLSAVPGESLFALHIDGMLVCFALDAGLLVVFVTRVNGNLRERDTRLAALRQRATEEDHVVRIGLLASGAAHELGTPLATLSVILGDWRHMPALTADPELRGEIDAMESEVRRCKAILTRILVAAGEARGESATVTTLHGFLDDLVADWRAARAATTLSYRRVVGDDRPIASDTALKQVIFNVLDNAYEASPEELGLAIHRDGDMLILAVTDAGPGFAPGFLEQVGKPYLTSKGRPGGGLGLFLVVNMLRKLGGRVTASNRPSGGAAVTLSLPLDALAVEIGSDP